MAWPSATIRRRRPGFSATWRPTTKKVALALRSRKVSRIRGVVCGSGPSSKVRATLPPEVPTEPPTARAGQGASATPGAGVEGRATLPAGAAHGAAHGRGGPGVLGHRGGPGPRHVRRRCNGGAGEGLELHGRGGARARPLGG